MKLPCYLVRDLLPLYKDEVCDPQTAADLKEHLAGCESCRAALAALAAEPAARAVEAEKQRADAVALRLLRRRLVVRWIAIALATAVLTLALLLGYRGGAGGQIRDIPADAIEEVVLREDGSLHALPDPYREVFWLRAYGELSFADIAVLFNKTESWARVTYYRAKTKLKEALE